MISKKTAYTAKCDRCNRSHSKAALEWEWMLIACLRKDGWRVTTEGHVLCPRCAAMEVEELLKMYRM